MPTLKEACKFVRSAREESWKIHSKGIPYQTKRGLLTTDGDPKESYTDYLPNWKGKTLEQTIESLIASNGTGRETPKITVEDGHKIASVYPPNTFDLVVSVQTMRYIADNWKVIKDIYRVLKPKGICLIDSYASMLHTPWNQPEEESERKENLLTDYLEREYGMQFHKKRMGQLN
ncbi:class I SAM-dependent methyltransferase [Patescibacteria group bacterium]|nr:class I SAM-dependent methyltransferase [Patescibacteria group bacterium]